ncbi:MAG: F0F1 ATP synthase subunit A [Patescibacteria group bacterium]|nr:F0F1 ATP synthase subunit A [Patescibacteria group bacterium]MDD5490435.1 F0F1 ATP synthase subunit A [Patescibacteria group bacterium]
MSIQTEQKSHSGDLAGDHAVGSSDLSGGGEPVETQGEVKHETTLFAEPIFNVGGFTVTNSLLNSWFVVALIVILAVLIRRKISLVPHGLQNIMEIIIEEALKLFDSVTGDRKKSLLFAPIVFCLFVFILLNNWLGLLPGIGSLGFVETHGGENIFIPLFRGATADLNTTLALALAAVIGSHIVGIIFIGVWNYFNKFINLKGLAEIPKKIFKDPTIIIVNPIKFFVGVVEIISEIAKVASLSFRLFGNIFAGEVLLASMAVLFAYILPIPFMFLEIIVGIIQALIFAMLTLVYFTIATSAHEEH